MAKERVEGKIGDEDVVLNNAATESTLENLLDQMKKMAKAQGLSEAQSKKNRKATEEYTKSVNEASKSTEPFRKQIEESTNALQDFKSGLGKVGGALGLLTRGVSSLVSGTYNLTESFMLGGDRLSEFFGGLPVFGTVTRALDDNIDVYRNISSVGATFGNSLQDMRLAAATARVSLDSFQNLVSNNSETLAIFGDSVSSGARQFSQFSGNFRESDIGQRFMGMGFTIEELNERLVGYIELEARRDRLEQLSQEQLTRGAENYLEQLDKLAKVTGMERKEAEELLLKQQQEANIRAMSNKLQGEQREQFENNIAMFENLTPSYATAFKDLLDGAAQTDEAIGLLNALGPAADPFMRMMQDVGRGRIPVEDTLNALATTYGPQLEQTLDGVGETVAQQLMLSGDPLGAVLSNLGEILRLNNNRLGEAAENEQDNRQTITEQLTGFQQTIQSIRNTILSTFLESDAFQGVTDTLDQFSKDILSSERIKEILNESVVPALRRFDAWLVSFLQDVQDPDTTFFEALGNAMDPVMDFMKEKLRDAFAGIKNILLGEKIQDPSSENRGQRSGGLVREFSEFLTSDRMQDIFQNMADTIVQAFVTALGKDGLLKQATSQMPGGGATTEDAEEIYRRLQSGEEVSKRERAKLDLFILEEQRRQQRESDNLFVRSFGNLRSFGSMATDPLHELLMRLAPEEMHNMFDENLQDRASDFFEGRRSGSKSIENFGSGTPMMLHGREAVLTEDQLFRMANGAFSAGSSTVASNIDQSRINSVSNTMTELKTAINDLSTTMSSANNIQDANPNENQTQSDLGRKLDQLNNTMESVVGILADTHNLSKRQLQSYNGLSGNLQRGIA